MQQQLSHRVGKQSIPCSRSFQYMEHCLLKYLFFLLPILNILTKFKNHITYVPVTQSSPEDLVVTMETHYWALL